MNPLELGCILRPFFVPCRGIDRMVCRGCILPSVGLCAASVAHNRQKPLERVIAAFAGVTGGRWIDPYLRAAIGLK
ncbi:hypothetical protein [uncultured Porphyromonas sp.]|uniref:hypothetical protein n=1 Tax=uncultured Porphyromonas sp. TaxID=159274 RepID=UPI002603FF62|nr:hypothetical protein [uncultured Porphyromonas sp.]